MLIDLLSTGNYNMYNVTIANKLGLHTAIYLSEIMTINDKAIRKNKIEDNYFILNRDYVKSRTTIDVVEQLDIDKVLLELKILEKDDVDSCRMRVNVTTLASILMNDDEELLKDVSKLVKKNKTKKATKIEGIIKNMKSYITTSNEELRIAYYSWIDAVVNKDGWMTKQAVVSAQKNIDSFSNHNLDLALKILEIATVNGYRDMTWAINNYKKDNQSKYFRKENNTINITKPVDLSTPLVLDLDEVF